MYTLRYAIQFICNVHMHEADLIHKDWNEWKKSQQISLGLDDSDL